MKRVVLAFNNENLARCLEREVSKLSNEWKVMPYIVTPSREGYLEKLARVTQLKNEWCDVIHADELVGNGPVAAVLGEFKNVATLGYMRGYGDYTNKHYLHGPLQKRKIRAKTSLCFKLMDDVGAISEAVKAGVSDLYPSWQCPVMERPYDVEYYSSGRDHLFDRPTVVSVTNLRYEQKAKGVKRVVEGFERAKSGDWQLVIAGAGNWSEYVGGLTRDKADVKYLGWRDDIPSVLASSEIFAYVSYLDGRPSTVYEARAAGLPVVAGDASGVPEASGEQYIVPPTSQGVEAGLVELMDNPDKRRTFGKLARENMQDHNERVTKDWIELWEKHV